MQMNDSPSLPDVVFLSSAAINIVFVLGAWASTSGLFLSSVVTRFNIRENSDSPSRLDYKSSDGCISATDETNLSSKDLLIVLCNIIIHIILMQYMDVFENF